MEERICLQPEYVSRFQCDGTACNAKCCKGWRITIDPKTYQKYCNLEPVSFRKRIISKMKYQKEQNQFAIRLDNKGRCPFLGKDFLCEIQKNYGAEYLSRTCRVYPRIINDFGDMVEKSLTLTCPVAAELVLLQEDPIAFEQVRTTPEDFPRKWPENIRGYAFDVQYGGISILQNRKLSIDQRLVVLGFFLDQANDMVAAGKTEQLKDLSALYASDDFMENVPDMLQAIRFQPKEYFRTMFVLLEELYGEKGEFFRQEQWALLDVKRAYRLPDEAVSIDLADAQEVYRTHISKVRAKLVEEFSHMLENFLVNEFFMNVYPFRIQGNFILNYNVFLLIYKLSEFIFCASASIRSLPKEEIVSFFVLFSKHLEHNVKYMQEFARAVHKQNQDIVGIMRNLLDVTPGDFT